MTVKQCADRLEVSTSVVYNLLLSGKLRCYRIGSGRGVYRIAEQHVIEFLSGAERRIEPPPAPVRRVTLRRLRLD